MEKGKRMTVKEPRAKQQAELYNLIDIRGLAKILSQYDLSEVEVEHQGQRIRIRRDRQGTATPLVPAPLAAPPSVLAAPAPTPVQVDEPAKDDGTALITSPFVGTFYRAPSPEAPHFVEEGQTVKKGQVLCIVEAMKLMNEIEAETDCKIVQILGKNAEPVEFGQPLFKVFPLA
jgi:acetyl-CoA carboxylase biotin carboxyl carrier protein